MSRFILPVPFSGASVALDPAALRKLKRMKNRAVYTVWNPNIYTGGLPGADRITTNRILPQSGRVRQPVVPPIIPVQSLRNKIALKHGCTIRQPVHTSGHTVPEPATRIHREASSDRGVPA